MKLTLLPWPLSKQRRMLLAGLICALFSAALWQVIKAGAKAQHARGAQLQALLGNASNEPGAQRGKPPTRDWITELPMQVSSQTITTRIRDAVETHGALLQTLGVAEQAATTVTLGRLIVDLELRGSYLAIKNLLIELLSREPGRVYLQNLTFRRRGNASELDSHVQLVWLSSPVPEPR